MKKMISRSNIIGIIASIILFIYISCNTRTDSTIEKIVTKTFPDTPRKVNSVIEEKFRQKIYTLIGKNEDPYYSPKYDSNSRAFVDTVLFNQAKDKAAFFVITMNSDNKLLINRDSINNHYDAHLFIAQKKSNEWHVKWVNAAIFTRNKTFSDASKNIREYYFYHFIERKDSYGNSFYKFNLIDTGFWSGPLW